MLKYAQAQGQDIVLEVGHTVLGRVLRLTSKQAHVEVLAVGEQALRQACQGIIKKEDVRQHDVGRLVCALWMAIMPRTPHLKPPANFTNNPHTYPQPNPTTDRPRRDLQVLPPRRHRAGARRLAGRVPGELDARGASRNARAYRRRPGAGRVGEARAGRGRGS